LAYAFIVAAIQTKNTKPQSLHSAVRARPRPRPALSALCKHVWRQCARGCTLGGSTWWNVNVNLNFVLLTTIISFQSWTPKDS